MRKSIWYCTKFDEVWLIEKYDFNKFIRAAFIADHGPADREGEWWETISWPRPKNGFPFVFIGYV